MVQTILVVSRKRPAFLRAKKGTRKNEGFGCLRPLLVYHIVTLFPLFVEGVVIAFVVSLIEEDWRILVWEEVG